MHALPMSDDSHYSHGCERLFALKCELTWLVLGIRANWNKNALKFYDEERLKGEFPPGNGGRLSVLLNDTSAGKKFAAC